MSIEHIIEISSIVIMLFLLVIFVPKHRIREASVIFLFKQFMT